MRNVENFSQIASCNRGSSMDLSYIFLPLHQVTWALLSREKEPLKQAALGKIDAA